MVTAEHLLSARRAARQRVDRLGQVAGSSVGVAEMDLAGNDAAVADHITVRERFLNFDAVGERFCSFGMLQQAEVADA